MNKYIGITIILATHSPDLAKKMSNISTRGWQIRFSELKDNSQIMPGIIRIVIRSLSFNKQSVIPGSYNRIARGCNNRIASDRQIGEDES